MSDTRFRGWTLIGAGVLALTFGVMIRAADRAPKAVPEDLRDAVAAAPLSPAALGGVRVVQPQNASYFAMPAARRADAEKTLMSSRLKKVSGAMSARAAELRRQAARERAMATTAQ